ncbi:hypothetical protein SAMN05444280_12121 [Tangfeifania diversioriginum]|uniref:Uncharacterized protein n=1 Tax=Tangfeifania diversioriginum TaxID=1168035 RepID=A0A1M6JT28_9BACT|nr:hypothetical protein SAMN05444280_12121 [Tangfeifania diversioriginum]
MKPEINKVIKLIKQPKGEQYIRYLGVLCTFSEYILRWR